MRSEYSPAHEQREGVLGPELLLSASSGAACVRLPDGTLLGEMPAMPMTNAFVVWIGYPVVVVSYGVSPANVAAVAAALRRTLDADDVPVVVNLGELPSRSGSTSVSDNPGRRPNAELARAEAYVRVQCAWDEGPIVSVDLDGERFAFCVEFRANVDGSFSPFVHT